MAQININETACNVYAYKANYSSSTPHLRHPHMNEWILIHDANGGATSPIKIYDTSIEISYETVTQMTFSISSTNDSWSQYVNDTVYGNGVTFIVVKEHNSDSILFYGRILTWELIRQNISDEFNIVVESSKSFAHDDIWWTDKGALEPNVVFCHNRICEELRYVHDNIVNGTVNGTTIQVSDINDNYRNKSTIFEVISRLESVRGCMFRFIPKITNGFVKVYVDWDSTNFEIIDLLLQTSINVISYNYVKDLTDTVSTVVTIGAEETSPVSTSVPDVNYFNSIYGYRARIFSDERYSSGLSDWGTSLINTYGKPLTTLEVMYYDINVSIFELIKSLHGTIKFSDIKYGIEHEGKFNTCTVSLDTLTTPDITISDLSQNVYSDVKLDFRQ